MKKYIITILLIALLIPSTVAAKDTLEQRVEELESRVSMLESNTTMQIIPSGLTSFSGHGFSQTRPFSVSGPFKVTWQTESEGKSTTFGVTVVYPENGTTAYNFGSHIGEKSVSGETWVYLPPGIYYLAVNTDSTVQWTVHIGN